MLYLKAYFRRISLFIFFACLSTKFLPFSYWVAADTQQSFKENNNVTNKWGNLSFSVLANTQSKWDYIDHQLRVIAAEKRRKKYEQEQEAREREEQYRQVQQKEVRDLQKRRTEYLEKYCLVHVLEEWGVSEDAHQERRLRAFKNFDPAKVVKRSYALNKKTKNFISKYGNAQEYQQFKGNEFQHVLHQELVDIQTQAADLVVDKVYQDSIGSFGELALQANKQGGVLFTSRLLDVCWGLLECGQAVAHGAKDGVINTVDACMHPTKTAKEMARGIVKTARAMAYVLKECGAISCYSMVDPEKLYDRFLTHKEQIEEVIEVVKSIPRYELIRCATALGVEVVLLERAMGAIGQFSKCSYNNANKWLDVAETVSEYSFAVEGAPNIIVPTVGDYLELMAQEAKKPVAKMHGKLVPALKGSATKWVALEEDLALLHMQFKGELIDIRPRHLFQPDIKTYITSFGEVKRSIGGWHHDLKKIIFKNKKFKGDPIEILNMRKGSYGIYELDWKMFGREKTSSFFPSDWTRQEVVKKILEAKKCIKKRGVSFIKQDTTRNFEAIGFTREGIKIKFIENAIKQLITIFPVLER